MPAFRTFPGGETMVVGPSDLMSSSSGTAGRPGFAANGLALPAGLSTTGLVCAAVPLEGFVVFMRPV